MLKKITGIGLVVVLAAALVGGSAYILLRPEAEIGLGRGAQNQEHAEAWPWLNGYRDGEAECERGQDGGYGRGWGHYGLLRRQEETPANPTTSIGPFRISVPQPLTSLLEAA